MTIESSQHRQGAPAETEQRLFDLAAAVLQDSPQQEAVIEALNLAKTLVAAHDPADWSSRESVLAGIRTCAFWLEPDSDRVAAVALTKSLLADGGRRDEDVLAWQCHAVIRTGDSTFKRYCIEGTEAQGLYEVVEMEKSVVSEAIEAASRWSPGDWSVSQDAQRDERLTAVRLRLKVPQGEKEIVVSCKRAGLLSKEPPKPEYTVSWKLTPRGQRGGDAGGQVVVTSVSLATCFDLLGVED